MVKRALDEDGFTLPDAAREVIFPRGVPVQLARPHAENSADEQPTRTPEPTHEAEMVAPAAEGDLDSEEKAIQEHARPLDEGEDLLKTNRGHAPTAP